MAEIGSLLHELEHPKGARAGTAAPVHAGADNQLVQVRLGTASSLFAALQCKHVATAEHVLRVALSCSAWALKAGLDPSERDAIEIAALLHDVGVIGTPDRILQKPGVLDPDEAAVMARSRQMSLEILRQSCTSADILDIVEYVGAWYDGSRKGFRLCGTDIPLGARMITIAEAFDAMVTDHVYRSAMSHERAMTELFDCAGTQFDPELVRQFAELYVCDQTELRREVASRWLNTLDPNLANSHWQLNCVPPVAGSHGVDGVFQAKLLENMYDAVVFIDATGQIALWNRGAERLTGIAGSSVRQRQWLPELLKMCDEKGEAIHEADCPVNCAIQSGVQSLRRLMIWGRTRQPVAVDTHAFPVIGEDGTTMGAVLLFHDASSEISLEQRCQRLHEKATKDPLTQVANRAEFDRVHEMFVAAHQQQQVPCSLIIGDLDHFKKVNDTYGHQAGDEVIKSLAKLLKRSCRPGDLVARYGGEEFVILCADCDNAAAARRAEGIRQGLCQLPQPKMGGRPSSVSFGVTEIQPGDTPETMLRRADRALLMAKERGRNNVVQLGVGSGGDEFETAGGFWRRKTPPPQEALERVLVTPVPIKMAIEKLRGFVADHQAKIVDIDGNHVHLQILDQPSSRLRRLGDRPVTFSVDARFEEERFQNRGHDQPSSGVLRTRIRLRIGPSKNRDRRRNDVQERAREVLVSFRSYLMAYEEEEQEKETSSLGALNRAKRILAPWLAKK
ncbi:MAG: diguanylate cyclase [Pirellulales bacterium]|nr:diguanylate cyclase [Pirellulales bacterium]